MAADRQEIRLQFLEEAAEHLDRIELGVLRLSASEGDMPLAALSRTAHSIKGGAAMMGFDVLSDLASDLEDVFRVLTERPEAELERMLLASIDRLRQVVGSYRRGERIEPSWLESVNSLFEQLRLRLGKTDSQALSVLSTPESKPDPEIREILFKTEVEQCLRRLESVLAHPDRPCLREEFLLAAQELGGLGDILELPAWSELCQTMTRHLEAQTQPADVVARLALGEWRRSQALILAGRFDLDAPATPKPDPITVRAVNLPPSETQEIGAAIAVTSPRTPRESEPSPDSEALIPVATIELPDEDSSSQTADDAPSPAQHTIRISAQQLEQLSDLFGELNIERNSLQGQLKTLRSLLSLLTQKVQHLEQANYRLRDAYDHSTTEASTPHLAATGANRNLSYSREAPAHSFDRLEMDRYSDLHPLFQEVMETIVQIQEVNSDINLGVGEAGQTAGELGRTAKLMRNRLVQIKMRPLDDLAGRFARAVRDMSLKYGKKAALKLKGGSTLIDRTISEALNEPLLHLIRNAFAHGIEDPATRRARGKPEQGTIEISAVYRGNQTLITVRDDGEGINLDKLRVQALDMGFAAAEIRQASDRDLLELIFEPGFSTAEQVTELSGRGVGMDVVRNSLAGVRGEIEVNTKRGVGTTFTLTVPLTLSVLRVLVVESSGVLLAFPTNAIESVLLLKPEMFLAAAGQEVLDWRGYMVPLIRLEHCLQFSRWHPHVQREADPVLNEPSILIVSQGEEFVALGVDRYWGEQEVTIRPVEGLKMPPGITGCTILEDGRVVPLADALSLLRSLEEDTPASYPQPALPKLPAQGALSASAKTLPQPTVLVIDDSITVRRFLAFTLEEAGYRVEQAKNGHDGWEKLHSGSVQAVVCDLEMPRQDGYSFLSQVKSDPTSKDLPVVMLTSRSSEKHRQLAMKLGATAYVSKPFKEQDLLQILAQILG